MKLQQIKRQLEREVKAHPGRAAALGLVLLVAGYMWAPLVWGAFTGGSKNRPVSEAPAAAPQPSTATSSDPATAAADVAEPTGREAEPSWREIVQWMQDDPRMLPVNDFSPVRNPFAVHAAVVQHTADDEPDAPPDVAPITPDMVGLSLTSTAIGSERRAAMINGRAYSQGERVVANLNGRAIEFYLVEVHDRHVVLLHGNQQLQLRMEPTVLEEVGVEVPDG
ncbi:MAG: hypothetical protein WDZ59_09940 [Pirellulales bacterium]